jgi:hypothetical protein
MKKHDDEEIELNLHPRPKETVALGVPQDTLESLKKVAANRDMNVEALVKLYVGQGLRQDLSRLFADRVLETTASVLARHLQSQEEISSIIREIRVETVGVK